MENMGWMRHVYRLSWARELFVTSTFVTVSLSLALQVASVSLPAPFTVVQPSVLEVPTTP